jgi:RNA polymerase sigma-70 factor (ECF subfamily)
LKKVLTDSDLVEQLQKGDLEAFDMVYYKYSRIIYAFGLRYLHSTEETEELVQSVFLKIWGNYKNLNKDLSFKSYIFTIAYNDICKVFRERNNHEKFMTEVVNAKLSYSSEEEDNIHYRSFLERLQKIIEKLPEMQKAIYCKSRQEYKSTREIANEVGLSPGTVDNYISESLKFIRHQLKNDILTVFILLSLFLF